MELKNFNHYNITAIRSQFLAMFFFFKSEFVSERCLWCLTNVQNAQCPQYLKNSSETLISVTWKWKCCWKIYSRWTFVFVHLIFVICAFQCYKFQLQQKEIVVLWQSYIQVLARWHWRFKLKMEIKRLKVRWE